MITDLERHAVPAGQWQFGGYRQPSQVPYESYWFVLILILDIENSMSRNTWDT